MYQINEQERVIAMATSRNRGAVGANAVVPRVVRSFALLGDTILDFGCGKAAAHVQALQDDDFDAVGFDFHLPGSEVHLLRQYSLVYASNVLNVQDSQDMMRETLRQMWACVEPGGLLIANLPTSPRKGAFEGMTTAQGNKMLHFVLRMMALDSGTNENLHCYPTRIGGTSQSPVFKIQKDY